MTDWIEEQYWRARAAAAAKDEWTRDMVIAGAIDFGWPWRYGAIARQQVAFTADEQSRLEQQQEVYRSGRVKCAECGLAPDEPRYIGFEGLKSHMLDHIVHDVDRELFGFEPHGIPAMELVAPEVPRD